VSEGGTPGTTAPTGALENIMVYDTNILADAALKSIPSVVGWVSDLGYSTGEDGDWTHPIASVEQLVELFGEHPYDDDAVLEALDLDCDIPEDSALVLIDYARRAVEAVTAFRQHLVDAIGAYREGDLVEYIREISKARDLERPWGDAVSCGDVADALGPVCIHADEAVDALGPVRIHADEAVDDDAVADIEEETGLDIRLVASEADESRGPIVGALWQRISDDSLIEL